MELYSGNTVTTVTTRMLFALFMFIGNSVVIVPTFSIEEVEP